MIYETSEIARMAHEVNRAYCEALGDHSQKPWEDAPDWQRASALKGVDFHLANPSATPAASHESWLQEKAAAGWKWGPEKDEAAKTHPCFMPYTDLPIDQRAKDFLFRGVVRAMSGDAA
ncbi:MAG TPA: RyR domain-containing protein [Ramlibacter sp.]|nr:RyR domain-containing protein [Ramlibacter sp.]